MLVSPLLTWIRAKYPLAVIKILLEAFGSDIGGGYDIGCKFGTTLDHSELGNQAHELNYKTLVSSFHGHAHNRLCQTNFLATYVKEMGLEDLESCECFFSKSNALASSIGYASIFHQKQKIAEYLNWRKWTWVKLVSLYHLHVVHGLTYKPQATSSANISPRPSKPAHKPLEMPWTGTTQLLYTSLHHGPPYPGMRSCSMHSLQTLTFCEKCVRTFMSEHGPVLWHVLPWISISESSGQRRR